MQANGDVTNGSRGSGALIRTAALAALIIAACSNGSTRREHTAIDAELCDGPHDGGSGSGSAINGCDQGSDACGSNAVCRSCIEDGACADGPDPIWTGSECVCADSPAHCQFKFCCALGFVWNPSACMCIGTP
jgi:hypothetical protein